MAFSLEFSPEFFFADGEPYDRGDLALNSNGNPVSLYSSILQSLEDPYFREVKDDELAKQASITRMTNLFKNNAASLDFSCDNCVSFETSTKLNIIYLTKEALRKFQG
jgi:hypothetical protein